MTEKGCYIDSLPGTGLVTFLALVKEKEIRPKRAGGWYHQGVARSRKQGERRSGGEAGRLAAVGCGACCTTALGRTAAIPIDASPCPTNSTTTTSEMERGTPPPSAQS